MDLVNVKRPWTLKDDDELLDLKFEGFSTDDIQFRLHRSASGITSRYGKLCVRNPSTGRDYWPQERRSTYKINATVKRDVIRRAFSTEGIKNKAYEPQYLSRLLGCLPFEILFELEQKYIRHYPIPLTRGIDIRFDDDRMTDEEYLLLLAKKINAMMKLK